MSKDLLLEIGTEEIPAGFMSHTFKQLEELATDLFTENRIEIGEIIATGTPRRLVLSIKDIAEKQPDLDKEVRGPAENIAFDDDGNPTKAGTGFARGQGITPDELEIRETDNGKYVFACTTELGEPTEELLPELLVKLINKLNFPKSMRWANQEMSFARPIKWILSLYGSEIIDFTIAGVKSDNWSKGHRFLSDGKIEIETPDSYFNVLEEEYVIVDHTKRRDMILKQIKEIEEKNKIEVIVNDELLTEVNFLVEYPTALCGEFSEEFLKLPSEVLITSMREHQRYFPVKDQEGNLKNLFVTVRNGNEDYLDIVRSGNEKVLQARLSDAIFFYEEDQKTNLEDKVKKLKDIIFQEDLGTIYEKVERMIKLSDKLSQIIGLNDKKINQAKRAAKLAKADLVTEMVNEFAKLQGVMGREYALIDGEKKLVANAIFEHYLPRYADDILPKTKVGSIVSIADKIDNIVGCFSVGIIPTGSQDPYALRRQAQGIINIMVDLELNLTLDQLIDIALESLKEQNKLKRSSTDIKDDILEFFKLRLEKLLEEKEIRYDVRDAVLATNYSDINDMLARAKAVMKFRQKEGFKELITAFNRASNLASKGKSKVVDPNLFKDESEQKLYSAYQQIKEEVDSLINKQKYVTALKKAVELKPSIDNFFDSVMVIADDEEIKENRLGLLKLISNLLSQIADLTKIVVD